MTRLRLRQAHSEPALERIYAKPHDHTRFPDHVLRVNATIQVGRWLVDRYGAANAYDFSCGDGAIVKGLGVGAEYLGDMAPGHPTTGPLEKTLDEIGNDAYEKADLYVCCETLEHLDDPDAILWKIRSKTSLLLLSTPVDAWSDDNPEHYWAWSRGDVEAMLAEAGFRVAVYSEVDFRPLRMPYSFGIWGCQ